MEPANPNLPIDYEWKQLQQNNDCSIPARERHCSLAYKGNLIIIGGQQNDGKYPEQVLMFDLTESVWSEVALLGGSVCAKFGFSACVYDKDKVIIYGGIHRGNECHVDKIELLIPCNTKELTFERKEGYFNGPSLSRAFHTANIFEDKMYVFGGQSSYQSEDNHLCIFDLKNFNVVHHSSNEGGPKGRIFHSSAVANGKIYIYGGYYTEKGSWGYYESYLDDLWCLDVYSLAWEKMNVSGASLGARKGSTMQYSENNLFIFGGSDKEKTFNTLIRYNIENQENQIIETRGKLPNSKPFQSSILSQGKMIIFADSSIYSLSLGKDAKEVEPDPPEKKSFIEKEAHISGALKKDLKKFFIERPYPDITFIIQDRQIPAHKGFLVSRCPYFSKLFAENVASNLEISNHNPEAFERFLEYLYCEEVELTDENSRDLLLISNEYEIPELFDLCGNFIRKTMKVENAIEIAILAEECKSDNLRRDVIKFILENRDIIFKREDFDNLPKSVLIEILKKV